MPDELDLLPGEVEPPDDEPEPEAATGDGADEAPGDGFEVVVEDIVFGDDVAAWLVHPGEPGAGTENAAVAPPYAGIVMWHWLSTEEPIGTRDEFLGEARELTRRGAVCLLPAGRFPWSIRPSGSAADSQEIRAEVARLSRGLDLLQERGDVDADRLAVVGHDFGAMYATIAMAADPRVRAAALVAPTPRWADWFLLFWDIPEFRSDYLQSLQALDPVTQMAALAPRPVLLQMATRDFYVPVVAGFELRAAAGDAGADSVRLETYDAEHDMDVGPAWEDRLAFLVETLGLR